MQKTFLLLVALLLSTRVQAQTLDEDTLRGPMQSFYKGCLAINRYLTDGKTEDIEAAMTWLNPRRTKVDVFTYDEIDTEAIVPRGEHPMYDYTYAKYLYENSDVAYMDQDVMRGTSSCYVQTITVRAKATVTFSVDVAGNESFHMFALCEPCGTVTLQVARRSDAANLMGNAYERGTVSFLSWFISNDDTLVISVSNTSDKEESIAIVSN